MANIETSISINKPVEKVFEYLTNVQNQKVLNPSINEVVMDGKMAVGTHYTIKMTVAGRAFESENEIVALEPNKNVRGQDPGKAACLTRDKHLYAREGRQRDQAASFDGRGGDARDRGHGSAATQRPDWIRHWPASRRGWAGKEFTIVGSQARADSFATGCFAIVALLLAMTKRPSRRPAGGFWFRIRSMRRTRRRAILPVFFVLFLLLSSCSSPTPEPTATNLPVIFAPIPASPTPAPTATAVPAAPRAQYGMNVVLDYAAKSVAVDETIVYPNHSGQALNDLVLAVEPNLWANCFALSSLSLDGAAVTDYALAGQKLSIPLPNVMEPETTVKLQLQYTLALPLIEPTNRIYRVRGSLVTARVRST